MVSVTGLLVTPDNVALISTSAVKEITDPGGATPGGRAPGGGVPPGGGIGVLWGEIGSGKVILAIPEASPAAVIAAIVSSEESQLTSELMSLVVPSE